MKTKFLLLAIAGTFAFTACSKDDDSGSGNTGGTNNQTTSQKIAHVWTGDEIDVTITPVLSPTTPLFDTTFSSTFATYTFNSNGNVSIDSAGTAVSSGTWAVIPNNQMILTLDGNIDTVDIVKINDTQFHYYNSSIEPSFFGDLLVESTTKLTR